MSEHPWPTPTETLWTANRSFSVNDLVYFARQKYKCTVAGVTSSVAPTHTTGTATDGTVTWEWQSTYDPLSSYARFRTYHPGDYAVKLLELYTES